MGGRTFSSKHNDRYSVLEETLTGEESGMGYVEKLKMTILSQDEMMKTSPLSLRKWLFAEKLPLIVILVVWAVVLCVGLAVPGPMIGDEVTHYYMLKTQANLLSRPNFEAHIPSCADESGEEIRSYPHTFAWHYIGACVYRLTSSKAAVQFYHSLFLLQLLAVVVAISKRVSASHSGSVLLALLTIVSLPMTLLFSVAFYQDVPATAQVVTAFFCLMRGQWLAAALFLSLGIGIKENMVLFIPAFILWLALSGWKRGVRGWALPMIGTLLVLVSSCGTIAWALKHYGQADYYPTRVIEIKVNKALNLISRCHGKTVQNQGTSPQQGFALPRRTTLYAPEVLANHPGDLRNPVNFAVYGGAVMWIFISLGVLGCLTGKKRSPDSITSEQKHDMFGLILTGISVLVFTCLFLNIPDARFFYPGLVFCLIPLAVYAVRLPMFRLWIWVFAAVAVLQSGVVLHKTHCLRNVSVGILDAVEYLRIHPPSPNRVLMYPEGNYRLFPCPHEWYLLPKYEIRELWKGNNDQRLELLRKHGVGAIVVKKHLVGKIDAEMENLGVYPDYFVKDIDSDTRFEKVLDNKDVTIYRLPAQSP